MRNNSENSFERLLRKYVFLVMGIAIFLGGILLIFLGLKIDFSLIEIILGAYSIIVSLFLFHLEILELKNNFHALFKYKLHILYFVLIVPGTIITYCLYSIFVCGCLPSEFAGPNIQLYSPNEKPLFRFIAWLGLFLLLAFSMGFIFYLIYSKIKKKW